MPRRPAFLAGPARFVLTGLLGRLRRGCLTICEDGIEKVFGGDQGINARIEVKKARFWVDLLLAGSIGATESYACGAWDTPDLTAVFRLFLQNSDLFINLDSGRMSFLLKHGYKMFHQQRQNTSEGSRANISAHYDIGNSFYRLMLDRTMTYSAGIFKTQETDLEAAQIEKYDRICRKLGLRPEHHLVEIGTGWGGMAEHAARNYGCRVTTTTISQQQYEFAHARISAAGLSDKVTILLEDYRNLTGTYDRLVSIEMIESVGHEFLPTYIKKCADLLKEDGLMALQAITIREQEYSRHVNEVDFIKRYIFPGSCLTSITSLCETMTRHTDLQIVNLEDITFHYARTLRCWLDNFQANIAEVRKLGFDLFFCRMWELYLQYCEAGFAEHYIGDVQIICSRPKAHETGLLL